MSPHAVIIGAGMGGLTSARILQKRGYRVTVLEQHYRPGGFLHRFFRQGRPYDTGFHYCGSVAAGQPLGQALRHLGVFDDLDFHVELALALRAHVFPHQEVAPSGHLYIITKGRALFAGGVLKVGSTWGTDEMIETSSLRHATASTNTQHARQT